MKKQAEYLQEEHEISLKGEQTQDIYSSLVEKSQKTKKKETYITEKEFKEIGVKINTLK